MNAELHSKSLRLLDSITKLVRSSLWRYFLACIAAFSLVLLTFYWAFCNVPRHSPQWTAERIDGAISDGLDYLARSGAFAKLFDQGGEHAMHHFILDQVLARQPHSVLRGQREYCDRANQRFARWRAFNALPGWRKRDFGPAERMEVQIVIRDCDNSYGRWLLWAVHASWAKLPPQDHRRLFEDISLLEDSYDLTHALMTYWLMQRTAPEVSARLQVSERIEQVIRRIRRYTTWAPRCGDSYLERVAFSLMIQPSTALSRRWIERILTVQNPDGGWTYVPPYSRTLQEMFGFQIAKYRSQPHPSFLALLALVSHRDFIHFQESSRADPHWSREGKLSIPGSRVSQ